MIQNCQMFFMIQSSTISTLLKVEALKCECPQPPKNGHKANKDEYNVSHHVMLIVKGVLQEGLHVLGATSTELNFVVVIADIADNQAIDRPCHRVQVICPEIPAAMPRQTSVHKGRPSAQGWVCHAFLAGQHMHDNAEQALLSSSVVLPDVCQTSLQSMQECACAGPLKCKC